jgi:hypothetical protein
MKFKLNKLEAENYVVLGIVSSEADYKISWALNHSLNIVLSRAESLIVTTNKGLINLEPTAYVSLSDESASKYLLIQNKCATGYFLDEFKNIDYFLIIVTELADSQLIVNKLKGVSHFTSILQINKTSIKHKDHIAQALTQYLS